MRVGSFQFNLRELAGSLGDSGTLLPLAIGYITVCKMNPAGLLVMMGLANVATGLTYRLPMPIEPMKVLAVAAIAQAWAPEKIYTSGLVMGFAWLLLGTTGAMTYVARYTPKAVVRGIQLSLGVLLAVQGRAKEIEYAVHRFSESPFAIHGFRASLNKKDALQTFIETGARWAYGLVVVPLRRDSGRRGSGNTNHQDAARHRKDQQKACPHCCNVANSSSRHRTKTVYRETSI